MDRANYYTAVKQPEVTTLHWIALNTPEDSVLVADHLLGWWLSGISQRPTFSAAGLEFLIYSHELEVAQAAHRILDTNYQIYNGFIQINEDGPYQSRHNPEFSYEKWAGESFGLIHFENNLTTICYDQKNITLTQIQVTQHALTYDENFAVLTTTYKNQEFIVTKTVQLQKGAKIAELTYDIQSKQIDIFDFCVIMNTTADMPLQNVSTSMMIGVFNWYEKVGGQVILEPAPLEIIYPENTTDCQLAYKTQNSSLNVKMQISVFDLENTYYDEFSDVLDDHADDLLVDEDYEESVTVWQYTDMLEEYDVSYVVCRDQDVYMKFAQDSKFMLIFKCENVAVFQVAN